MDTFKKISLFLKQKEKQKLLAEITLLILSFATLLQFAYIRQNSYSLDSVIIPKTMIWEVNKQPTLFAFILTVGNLAGLVFYFFKRYSWTVLVILICLVAVRYVYI